MSAEDFMAVFQSMMQEMLGGVSINEMLAGLSPEDLADMPPFPFPKELFPAGEPARVSLLCLPSGHKSAVPPPPPPTPNTHTHTHTHTPHLHHRRHQQHHRTCVPNPY